MFKLTVFIIAVIAVSFTFADNVDEAWTQFKVKHNKNYRSTDEAARKRIFSGTHSMIQEHNSNNPDFQMEHNEFSDMTQREKDRFLGIDSELVSGHQVTERFVYSPRDRQLPDYLDYHYHPCMNPVRNQGQCGSCWAFATIAALEFSKCMQNNNQSVALSEQQLVDCDPYDGGCNGGWYSNAWRYLMEASGSAKQQNYAYTAAKGSCKFSTSSVGAKVYGFGMVADAIGMQYALLKHGPLAVAINVTSDFFQYKSGIYSSNTCTAPGKINHAVVVVGFGEMGIPPVPYWVVRNSWGTGWGMNGYILMKRGDNMCNIESYAYYVDAYP